MSEATVTPSVNGTNGHAERQVEPVSSYREAAPLLRRPFTEQAVKFKVQATWEGGGLIVAYIDARLAVERLNLVCPHLWHDHYEPISGKLMWCHLTVDGITRSDVGEGEGKGLVSDALKRAAVKFGVGVSLYAIPKLILRESDGHLKPNRKDKYELTPNGETRCRQIYATWLDTRGHSAFGGALDHGDVADAAGDHEADRTEEPTRPAATTKAAPAALDEEFVQRTIESFKLLRLPYAQINLHLQAVGGEAPKINRSDSILKAVRELTPAQLEELWGRLDELSVEAASA